MKRRIRPVTVSIALILIMLCCAVMGGCSKAEPSAPESDTPDSSQEEGQDQESEPTPAEISEKAMQNFLDLVQEGNYVMTAPGFRTTSVSSGDLVSLDYEDDESYSDFAVMSVGGEVFQARYADDGMGEATYLGEGDALSFADSMLPSYWLSDEASGGNIFNVFYNDQENPLVFVSYDEGIKSHMLSLAGYGNMALKYMHELYLTLDAEEPAQVHVQAVMDDDEVARYYFDDIDVTIAFGGATADDRAAAWMQAPVYPDARTAWTEGDIFVFNSVFLPGYGEKAIPYITSASYALKVDDENFLSDDTVYIRDPHATEKDVEDYIAVLKENGFEEYTEDGETTYRLLLRDETKCYSSISLVYDSGLSLEAKKAYDFPKYEGLGQINDVIKGFSFPELAETDVLTDFTAEDRKWAQTEGWLYFYEYNTALYATARYSDEEQVNQYLDAYVEALEAQGFAPHESGEGEVDYYQDPDEVSNFRWHFEEDGETLILLYKSEKRLDAAEAEDFLSKGGFPRIDFAGYLNGKNTVKFMKTMYGRDFDPSVSLTWRFDSAEEGEAFLDSLVETLEADDFLRVPASQLTSNKSNGYTNEEKGLGVAFDFFPGESDGGTYIYFDFRGGIDFSTYDESEEDGGNKPILGWRYWSSLEPEEEASDEPWDF